MDVTSDVIFMKSLAYPTRVEYRQVVGSERLVPFLALALYNMGEAPSSGVGVVKCVVNSRRMVLALERTGRSGFDKVRCHQPIPHNTNGTRPSKSAFPPQILQVQHQDPGQDPDSQLQSQLGLDPLAEILGDLLLRGIPVDVLVMQVFDDLGEDDPAVV